MRLLLLLLLAASTALAEERSLYWDAVHVEARLDERGVLHVREQQTYVFDGAWNGGERVFRVEPGQQFEFERLSRVNPDGSIVAFEEGSLDEVGNYGFVDARTLRWRSRAPSDPPYGAERIAFVLEYTLSNVLLQDGDRYRLNHDFAFPERSGPINRIVVDLELAPEWVAEGAPFHFEGGPLRPGRSYIVDLELEYRGREAIAAERDWRSGRQLLAVALLLLPVAFGVATWRRERELGRFAPLTAAAITPEWIREHLLPMRAEVVGAAWDEAVGAGEVAALLARWTAEGKVGTKVDSDTEMRMWLKVPREEFRGYEKTLMEGLFVNGESTSSSELKSHYKKQGFHPAGLISPQLLVEARELSRASGTEPKLSPLPTLLLFIAALAFMVTGFMRAGGRPLLVAGAVVLIVCWIVGAVMAVQFRSRIDWGARRMVIFIIPLAVAAVMTVAIVLTPRLATPFYLGFALLFAAVTGSVWNAARSRHGREAMSFRKRLASVREYFVRELQKERPAIDDSWFPWVVAFGLDDEATRWTRQFAAESTSRSTGWTSSSASGSSSSPSWSGGGGSFGGAGATGSWSAAATGIAAGVASASSSSGGGGGGGGSSSGGGGGGGW